MMYPKRQIIELLFIDQFDVIEKLTIESQNQPSPYVMKRRFHHQNKRRYNNNNNNNINNIQGQQYRYQQQQHHHHQPIYNQNYHNGLNNVHNPGAINSNINDNNNGRIEYKQFSYQNQQFNQYMAQQPLQQAPSPMKGRFDHSLMSPTVTVNNNINNNTNNNKNGGPAPLVDLFNPFEQQQQPSLFNNGNPDSGSGTRNDGFYNGFQTPETTTRSQENGSSTTFGFGGIDNGISVGGNGGGGKLFNNIWTVNSNSNGGFSTVWA
ncbi:uncharacterized protein KQ657_004165 [Scheffersomyces spartinae]|uniref:Uncharacterized protein n=1 Tax=Scheffersomyces spartinae TaxID=45513 RepID=A0A9P7VCM5_9ASCO|nr:uncharacterized protein KQ657_004165 [Scheffersomyces spartinae]KAG7195051.1 hypothetical protein KQ657_004165 [Scheffersomyces spartinae]